MRMTMSMRKWSSLLFVMTFWACVALTAGASAYSVDTSATYSIFAEWTVLDYMWDENHTRDSYLSTGDFIPSNNAPAGINVDSQGNIYVTVPRWKSGVPSTLNQVVKNATGQYVMRPWPSWDMQEVGVAGNLQNCQSMKIDSQGRMWVIEVGRRNFFDVIPNTVVNNPAGVWMIDVSSGTILSKYVFPEEVVSSSSSFVNDIVLDEAKEIAYLTDAWGDGALLVYNYQEQTSRRYSGPSTAPDSSYVMIVNGVNYGTTTFTTPIDGIAITDDHEAIFYCNVQGTELHRVPTAVLNDFSSSQDDITAAVEVLGTKQPSDGMMYRNGVLYFGSLPESTYYALPVTATSYPPVDSAAVPVWPQQVDFRWVDTFSQDLSNSSKFWFISNSLDLFVTLDMDFTAGSGNSNFRIISATSTNTDADTDTSNAGGGGGDDDDSWSALQIACGVLASVLLLAGLIATGLYLRPKDPASGTSEPFLQ